MPKQPESRIVDAIMADLRGAGAWCFKVHGGMYQAAGVPDIIGCLAGRFFAVEVKVPGGKATKLQELTLQRIRSAGGRAGVATSVAEARGVVGLGEEQAENRGGG